VNSSLEFLQQQYPDDNITSNAQLFTPPPSYHTTVFYLGENASEVNSPYY